MEKISALFDSVPQAAQWSLAVIGAFWAARAILNGATFFLNNFVLPGTNLRKYGKKGTWAVVTGASDGLGKEFASQLAAKGFNMVLVSRTQAKLDTLAAELEQKHAGLQTRVLAMDFSRDDDGYEAAYDQLASLVAGLDVGILINNVGQSHSIPVSFLQTERAELDTIVRINCLGTLRATQAVAPAMVRRHQADRSKRALILTLGSFSGWVPTPYLATYSGSKAFLQHWSSALASELAADGVDVQVALGYLIVSAMSKVRRASLTIPNARPWVRAALAKVGRTAGPNTPYAHTVTPWWSHALMQGAVESTVGSGSAVAIDINRDMHINIRARALRKAAREAKKA